MPPMADQQPQMSVVQGGEADDATSHLRQTEIPGTERPRDPQLDKDASKYVKLREQRTELQSKEKELKLKMSKRLDELSLDKYEFVDGDVRRVIERNRTESITVSIVGDDE